MSQQFSNVSSEPETTKLLWNVAYTTKMKFAKIVEILSVQCYAWTKYKFTCVCVSVYVCLYVVCVSVRHTFCQLAYEVYSW